MPGYRVEHAASGRAKCNGPMPCKGSPIEKATLRHGSWLVMPGTDRGSFKWRHWGCVTPKIIENMKKDFEDAEDLDGFEELPEAEQDKIREAWKVGHVDPADVPETAKKPEESGDEYDGSPKKASKATPKKKAPAKAKTKAKKGSDDDSEEEGKPKKRTPAKKATPKKATKSKKKAETESDESEAELSESEPEASFSDDSDVPKKKGKGRGKATPKSKSKGRAKKDESESDFTESEPEAPPPKSKKRGAAKAAPEPKAKKAKPAPASASSTGSKPASKGRAKRVVPVSDEDSD